MRILSTLVIMTLVIVSCASLKGGKGSYGPVKVDMNKSISVSDMLKDFEGKSGRVEYTFEAPLNEVCSKAGCWVNIDKGNGDMFMVRFKDHFTIPTTTPIGTLAVFHGYAFQDTVSVELLRHFAEDAGKTQEEIEKINEPKITFGFEADGVKLKQ
jgi:hypothetical protein